MQFIYIYGFDDDDELVAHGVILPLLNALTLPALRSLNVGEGLNVGEEVYAEEKCGIVWDSFPGAELLALQARSGFDLRTLSFNNTYIEATELRDILQVSPSLISLSLFNSLCQRDFLKAVCERSRRTFSFEKKANMHVYCR